LTQLFTPGSKAGIQPAHAARLARMLHQLGNASSAEDMAVPGWYLLMAQRTAWPWRTCVSVRGDSRARRVAASP
jgi:proteic killer suppression protein